MYTKLLLWQCKLCSLALVCRLFVVGQMGLHLEFANCIRSDFLGLSCITVVLISLAVPRINRNHAQTKLEKMVSLFGGLSLF